MLPVPASGKYRNELESKVHKDANNRSGAGSATKQARYSLERDTKKAREELLSGVAVDVS